jgi:4-carboxymuconolactone decarboxylase
VRRDVLGADYVDKSVAAADDFTAPFQKLLTEWCWGDTWTRPGLDRKTRSMLNLAMLTALNRPHEIKLHVRGALNNGLTQEQIREVLLHTMVYCGVPAALDAFKAAKEVIDQAASQPVAASVPHAPVGAIERKLGQLGIELPPAPRPMANYVTSTVSGDLLFLAGQGPRMADGSWHSGKVGKDVTVEQAYEHARIVGIRMLAVARDALGTLDRVAQVVKLTGFVNGTADFTQPPKVINGCSDLMVEVFGEAGRHARSAVGVASLPEGITVEIEGIFRIR